MFIKKSDIWHSDNPAAAAAKSIQSCPTLCDPIDGSPPGDFPGKSTGVGCHCLLHILELGLWNYRILCIFAISLLLTAATFSNTGRQPGIDDAVSPDKKE